MIFSFRKLLKEIDELIVEHFGSEPIPPPPKKGLITLCSLVFIWAAFIGF